MWVLLSGQEMLPVNIQLPQIPLLQLPNLCWLWLGIAEPGCLQRVSRPGLPAALPTHSFAFHLWPLPPIFSLVSRAEADRSCLLALGVTLATSEPEPPRGTGPYPKASWKAATLPILASPLKGTPLLTSQASKSAKFPQQLLETIFQ